MNADYGGTTQFPFPPAIAPEKTLNAAQWGMLAFLVSEVAFFGTLITAYVAYMGHDIAGPASRDVLSLPLVIGTTICLLASSGTIHWADGRLHQGCERGFLLAWAATIVLGIAFLLGTAHEWRELISEHQLTISRNLFGTTFYTLVGFHGLHVTIGVVMMLVVLGLMLGKLCCGRPTRLEHAGETPTLRVGETPASQYSQAVQLISWYWHFVDGVWIVVFTVVYLVGR